MQRLFQLSYLRVLARLGLKELTVPQVGEALTKNNIPSSGEAFLYRLPREELKNTFNIPCPINSLEDPSAKQIIAASKALRHHSRFKEQKICFKCPFKDQCSSAKQPYSGNFENTPKDLLTFWVALDKFARPEDIYFRQWTAAYKMGDSFVASLNDLAEGGKQLEDYDKLRIDAKESYETKTKAETKESIDQTTKEKESKKAPSQQMLGRDFSFDQEAEFEPLSGFTKENYEEPKQEKLKPKLLKTQKGYQRIERNEDTIRPSYHNQERGRQQRGDYFEKGRRQERERYQEQDRYERPRQGKGRPQFQNQYDRPQRQEKGRYQYENEYQRPYKQERNFRNKQFDSSFDERPPKYQRQQRYENYEKDPEEWRNQRHQGQKYQKRNEQKYTRETEYSPKGKSNPFVSKWEKEDDFEFRREEKGKQRKGQQQFRQDFEQFNSQAFQRPQRKQKSQKVEKVDKTERGEKTEKVAQPRIIEVEEIDEAETTSRAGRLSRRRPRG